MAEILIDSGIGLGVEGFCFGEDVSVDKKPHPDTKNPLTSRQFQDERGPYNYTFRSIFIYYWGIGIVKEKGPFVCLLFNDL